jgi:hypothetical protein
MATLRAIKPTLAEVHEKIFQAFNNREDKQRASYAVDAIKFYGIDEFFCHYARFLTHNHVGDIGPVYIHAAELYHGSKQHWRRRT